MPFATSGGPVCLHVLLYAKRSGIDNNNSYMTIVYNVLLLTRSGCTIKPHRGKSRKVSVTDIEHAFSGVDINLTECSRYTIHKEFLN